MEDFSITALCVLAELHFTEAVHCTASVGIVQLIYHTVCETRNPIRAIHVQILVVELQCLNKNIDFYYGKLV